MLEAKEDASLLQQGGQQSRMVHENFCFATTYHERQEEMMSGIGQVTPESNGMPLSSVNHWRIIKPQGDR